MIDRMLNALERIVMADRYHELPKSSLPIAWERPYHHTAGRSGFAILL